MTRKESEKDAERPHYYSQFWLDVAAGRRIIGAPKPNEDGDFAETESEHEVTEPVSPAVRRGGRSSEDSSFSSSRTDDHVYEEEIHPVSESLAAGAYSASSPEEEAPVADESSFDQEDENYTDAPIEDSDIPDMDLGEEEPEFDEDEDDFSEEEEEEDDDTNWGRGRKKAKPTRPTKPVTKRAPKRDSRRSY